MYIQAPHQAHDRDKLAGMMVVLRRGGTLPAILVDEEGQAYSGSHRIEAVERIKEFERYCDIEDLEYIVITMEQRAEIMESMNLSADDEVSDFEPFLEEALYLGIVSGCS